MNETNVLMQTVSAKCLNPECSFVGNYHNTTIESVIQLRLTLALIEPIENECVHECVSYEVKKYGEIKNV